MADGQTTADDRKLERMRQTLAEIERIHLEYMARYARLRTRQTALLRDVLARIDREQAQKILSAINNSTESN